MLVYLFAISSLVPSILALNAHTKTESRPSPTYRFGIALEHTCCAAVLGHHHLGRQQASGENTNLLVNERRQVLQLVKGYGSRRTRLRILVP